MSNDALAAGPPAGQPPHPADPKAAPPDDPAGSRRRWLILSVGLVATTAGCTFQYGLAYLIPAPAASGGTGAGGG